MKFTLTIDLGNDAMLSGDDLDSALARVGALLRGFSPETFADKPHTIRDANGNKVGTWKIER